MDEWEGRVAEGVRAGRGARAIGKLLAGARALLQEDLAPFEIEEVVSSLLGEPVELLSAVWKRRAQDEWANTAGDTFDLLAAMLPRYSAHVEPYMETIVKLCMNGSFTATVRHKAMKCLVPLSRCTNASAHLHGVLSTLLDMLRRNDEILSCRIPLAELIGSICENYPELITDHTAVWRSYCAILEVNKTKDTLANAVITGVSGLFSKFGDDLPTSDLSAFAEKILTKYILIKNCERAVLRLVARHSRLFPEVLAHARHRAALGECVGGAHRDDALEALVAAYAAAGRAGNVEELIWTEVRALAERYPRAPLLLARCAHAAGGAGARLRRHCARAADAVAAELERRAAEPPAAWEYDAALHDLMEQAAWWVGRGDGAARASLRCVVRLQARCPPAQRKRLVAHTILRSDDKRGIIGFLISESCRSADPQDGSIRAYLPLWRDLFDSDGGRDELVAANSRLVFEELLERTLAAARVCLQRRQVAEESKEKLSTLFLLVSSVLSMEHVEDWLGGSAEALTTAALDCCEAHGPSEGALSLVATLAEAADRLCLFEDGTLGADVVGRLKTFYKALSPSRCGEERVLVCACRALVLAPARARGRRGDVRAALQIMFSRRDVEPALLSAALRCLDELAAAGECADQKWFAEVLVRIEKLAESENWPGKDARILRRNIFMFLGKYGCTRDLNNNALDEDIIDDTETLDNADIMSINLHDPLSITLDVEHLFRAALRTEDSEALWHSLLLMCSAASNNHSSALERRIARCVYALCRCYSRGELGTARAPVLEQAALWGARADVVSRLVDFLSSERSPGVRRVLSSMLEQVLLRDPHSEPTQDALRMITERATILLGSDDPLKRKAGLDVTEAIIPALKDNNEFSKSHVPELLALILKSQDADFESSFTPLSKYFQENIIIFEKDRIENLARGVVMSLFLVEIEDFGVFKRAVRKSLDIFKLGADFLNLDDTYRAKLSLEDLNDDVNLCVCLYVTAEYKTVNEWDAIESRSLVSREDFALVKAIFARVNRELGEDGVTVSLVEAMLKFLGEFAVYLMEFQYEKTSQVLAKILTHLPAKALKKLTHETSECLQKYHQIWVKNVPSCIKGCYKKWLDTLPIKDITDKMKFHSTAQSHKDCITQLKITLNVLNHQYMQETFLVHSSFIKQWPKIIMSLFEPCSVLSIDRTKMAYLTEALTIGLCFVNTAEVVDIISQNVKFYQKFVPVFGGYLMRESGVLFDERMRPVLKDVVGDFVKFVAVESVDDKERADVIELIDKLWPSLEANNTEELCAILTELSVLSASPLAPGSRPGRWLLALLARPELELAERVLLMETLPVVACGAGHVDEELFDTALKAYKATLPKLLSELAQHSSPRALSAALHALAATADRRLLRLVVDVAIGDKTSGWWDSAIENCMEALAVRGCVDLADDLYSRAVRSSDTLDCRLLLVSRLLVPLLQWSTPSFCEQFFSSQLPKLLATLKSIPSDIGKASQSLLNKHFVDYTIAFSLARVMFEKVSCAALESCESALYARVRGETGGRSWWCVVQVCALATALRNKFEAYATAYSRQFHCANYNCMAAAISKRRPSLKLYDQLLQAKVWPLLIDCETPIQHWGPLGAQPRSACKRHNVSVVCVSDSSRTGGSRSPLTLRRTARTGLFLRTLSDNLLQYDLLNPGREDETSTCQSLLLTDNDLNGNECAATVSAVLCHLAEVTPAGGGTWVDTIASAVASGAAHTNVRATLAQVICNCRTELHELSGRFRAALLSVVRDRPAGSSDINGLDVAVLDTVFFWAEKNPPTELDTEQSRLISECLEFLLNDLASSRHNGNVVPKIIQKKIEAMVKHFGAHITLPWSDLWKATVIDKHYNEFAIQAWITITKSVRIPELAALVVSSLAQDHIVASTVRKISELFGLALANCQNGTEESDSLTRFRKVLDALRAKDKAEYIGALYYAQTACKDVCNEHHFRIIMGLTSQMPAHLKRKCLMITAGYLSGVARASDVTADLFESTDLSELLLTGDCVQESLAVASNGLRLMVESMRRRIVSLVLEHCGSGRREVRKLAYEVLASSLDAILAPTNELHEPLAKRARGAPTSRFAFRTEEQCYERRVLAALAVGLLDRDPVVAGFVFDAVEKHLTSTGITVRLSECMAAAFPAPADALPTDHAHARRLSVFVRLLLERARRGEYYARRMLANSPLKSRIESSTSECRLVSLSSRYQGSFRSQLPARGARSHASRATADTGAIDVTDRPDVDVPVDVVLKAFIDFAARSSDGARALTTAAVRGAARADGAARAALAGGAAAALRQSGAAPALLEAVRLCAAECANVDGVVSAVDSLAAAARGSASEALAALAVEDLALHTRACESSFQWLQTVEDVEMEQYTEFTIEGLPEAWRRLADWEELGERGRRAALAAAPPLWTDDDTFAERAQAYFGRQDAGEVDATWPGRLWCARSGAGARRHGAWLRDARAWPAHAFAASATAEAIEWHEVRTGARDASELCARPLDVRSGNLAETATLLLFRSLMVQSLPPEGAGEAAARACRERELTWTRAAVQRGLRTPALACVRRNVAGSLYQSETLPWLLQQFRCKMMERCDAAALRSMLDKAELSMVSFKEYTAPEVLLEMNELIVALTVEESLQDINNNILRTLVKLSAVCKEMRTLCDVAPGPLSARAHASVASYCDALLERCEDLETRDSVLRALVESAAAAAELDRAEGTLLTALAVRRATDEGGDIIKLLLAKLSQYATRLDSDVLDVLRSVREGAWADSIAEYPALVDVLDDGTSRRELWVRCLSSLRDPTHALLATCQRLGEALSSNDEARWRALCEELQRDGSEPARGVAYRMLEPQRTALLAVRDYQPTSEFRAAARRVLGEVAERLRPARASLPLADICPALAAYPRGASERDGACLEALLGVEGRSIVRFDQQVKVIVDSQRRPVLLGALLSDGRARTYLVKCGEDLRRDAACQRAQAHFNSVLRRDTLRVHTYKVTPLGDAAGLIEYLAGWRTMRDMIKSTVDVNGLLSSVNRPSDRDIPRTPRSKLLSLHRELVAKSPPGALRSAIEASCASVEQFIKAKAAFLDSVAAMTVSHWLLGAGDRHLENALVEGRGGRACAVDWGYALDARAAAAPPELQPARLTRQLLAVNLNARVGLERRMERAVAELRAARRPLHAACALAFRWDSDADLPVKLERMKRKLSGEDLSFHSTLAALDTSTQQDAGFFRTVLLEVAGNAERRTLYSVEEQVSSILRQCTSEEILAVSRAGWEPWL